MSGKPYRKNVAILVVNDRGEVLAGERADLPGVWQLPQGGIEDGETPEQAALRELSEEIGVSGAEIVTCAPGWYSYDFPEWLAHTAIARQYRGQMQRYAVARLPEGCLPDVSRSDGEFTAFRWLLPDALLEQIVDFKKAAYREAFSDLADWLSPKK